MQLLHQVAREVLTKELALTGRTLEDYKDPVKRKQFHQEHGRAAVSLDTVLKPSARFHSAPAQHISHSTEVRLANTSDLCTMLLHMFLLPPCGGNCRLFQQRCLHQCTASVPQIKAAVQKKEERKKLAATRPDRKVLVVAALKGKLGVQELEERLQAIILTSTPQPSVQQQQQEAYRQQQENVAPEDAHQQLDFPMAQQQGLPDSSTATAAQGLLRQTTQQQQHDVAPGHPADHPTDGPYHHYNTPLHDTGALDIVPESNGHHVALPAAAGAASNSIGNHDAAEPDWTSWPGQPQEPCIAAGVHAAAAADAVATVPGHPRESSSTGGGHLATETSAASSTAVHDLDYSEYVAWSQYEALQNKYREAKERFFKMKEIHGRDKVVIEDLSQELAASKQQVGHRCCLPAVLWSLVCVSGICQSYVGEGS